MDPERLEKVPFSDDRIFGVQACLYVEYDEQGQIRRLSLPALHPSATYYNLSLQHHAKISDIAWNFVLSGSGKEAIDHDFYSRRATIIRDLASDKQAGIILPRVKQRKERVSRPVAPLGHRYEQSGQYVQAGLLRKSWLYSMEMAQAKEAGLHVEREDYCCFQKGSDWRRYGVDVAFVFDDFAICIGAPSKIRRSVNSR